MVNKVEKIKIEDESNGNGNAVTLDVTDNNLTDEIDNSFEDEEQVSGSDTLNISVTRFLHVLPQVPLTQPKPITVFAHVMIKSGSV